MSLLSKVIADIGLGSRSLGPKNRMFDRIGELRLELLRVHALTRDVLSQFHHSRHLEQAERRLSEKWTHRLGLARRAGRLELMRRAEDQVVHHQSRARDFLTTAEVLSESAVALKYRYASILHEIGELECTLGTGACGSYSLSPSS